MITVIFLVSFICHILNNVLNIFQSNLLDEPIDLRHSPGASFTKLFRQN